MCSLNPSQRNKLKKNEINNHASILRGTIPNQELAIWVNSEIEKYNYLEDRRRGPDGWREEGCFCDDGLLLGVRLGVVSDLSLRERSTMPSFCILSRFALILSCLDCS